MLGLHFAEELIASKKASEEERVNLFMKFEQLVAYSRYAAGPEETTERILGITRVKKRLDGRERIMVSAAQQNHILSNQKTYGIWGLYSVAGAQSGLAERGSGRLSPLGREFVEQPLADWQGAIVELVHVTTPCNEVSDGLRAFVADHMEFANCAVDAPKSLCSPGAEAAVAIDVQPHSIIYDFSNVADPGVFGRADFNGYVIADLLSAGPRIVAASIDREATTFDLDDNDIVVDGDSVRTNFEGLAFDAGDFVKIDLVFESPTEP